MGGPQSPSAVLQLRYYLESLLSSARSLQGAQMEALRRGTVGVQGGAPDSGEGLRLLYLDLLALCRSLSEEQERLCRLRFGTPSGWESYERNAPGGEVQRQPWVDGPGQLETLGTPEGEDMVRPLPEGRVLVRGRRACWPSYEEIAAQVGLSPYQVRRRLGAALGRVAQALRRRRGR